MKVFRLVLVLCVMIALIIGCATIPMASAELDAEAKTFTPPPGKANLYIVRHVSLSGNVIVFPTIVDDKSISSIGVGTYHLITVDPGKHAIIVNSDQDSTHIQFVTVADTNYFFKVFEVLGRVKIEEIDEETGKTMVEDAERAESLWDY